MSRDVFVRNAIMIKHAGGRPTKFKSNLDLIAAIEEYFDYCDNRVKSMYVKELGDNVSIASPAPYTMSGLARYLGVDRDTILRYSKHDEFYGTIRAAKSKIEEDIETRLLEGRNATGAIFALKNNHGWVDKSEVDNKHQVVTPLMSLEEHDAVRRDDSNTED